MYNRQSFKLLKKLYHIWREQRERERERDVLITNTISHDDGQRSVVAHTCCSLIQESMSIWRWRLAYVHASDIQCPVGLVLLSGDRLAQSPLINIHMSNSHILEAVSTVNYFTQKFSCVDNYLMKFVQIKLNADFIIETLKVVSSMRHCQYKTRWLEMLTASLDLSVL